MRTVTKHDLADGVHLTQVLDSRFRACSAEISFFLPHTAEYAAETAVLCSLLTDTCAAHQSIQEMSRLLDRLYGSELSASVSVHGNAVCFCISAQWLDDAFALDGEPVTAQMSELIVQCMTAPQLDPDGKPAFSAAAFEIPKQNLLRDIDSIMGEKRSYLDEQMRGLLYAGMPAAIPRLGTRAQAEQITPEGAYAAWQRLLHTARVEIVTVLPAEKPELTAALREMFAGARQPCNPQVKAPVQADAVPREGAEDMDAHQSKLMLCYSAAGIPDETMGMLSMVLGGFSESMLFLGVREAEGLCYYCDAYYYADTKILVIDTGADERDLARVRARIGAVLADLQAHEPDPAQLTAARLTMEYRTAQQNDEPAMLAGFYTWQQFQSRQMTPEELLAAQLAVTGAQITEAAQRLKLAAVYTLHSASCTNPA